MSAIYETTEYQEMADLVYQEEEREISRGDIIQRGGTERQVVLLRCQPYKLVNGRALPFCHTVHGHLSFF